jgi:hypothetical protein
MKRARVISEWPIVRVPMKRRRAAVRARRFVGFAAVVAVTLPPGRR